MTEGAATALWITAAGQAELRPGAVSDAPGAVPVETRFSAISRGTERLVYSGKVPESEWETMRAPFQEGACSFPVKYGYSAVGIAQKGALAGRPVFALFPHQTRFALPEAALIAVPEAVPPARAVLAANMETALNIVWDAGIGPGDRVAVVGCGVVGALAGYLATRIPGTEVTMIDVNPARADLATSMGAKFAAPGSAPGDCDVVIHASASAPGLATAIALAGVEATVIEASWYGADLTPAPLGGAFHQRRLKLISSQVGRIPTPRAPRWDFRRRLGKAMHLLADPALDALIPTESRFADLATDYAAILNDPETLCHRVRYGD